MKHTAIRPIVLSAMFLGIGLVLPLLTSQIKEIGDSLLPMHIPVMLCGIVCGAKYGLLTGLLLPILRAAMFGMPPIYPNAIWMAFELATYGLVIGWMYIHVKGRCLKRIYISLVTAMLAGRVVWGVAKAILLGIGGKPFGIAAFVTGSFLDAFPGIVVQLILIPLITNAIKKIPVLRKSEVNLDESD